jgi:hypothetical protein
MTSIIATMGNGGDGGRYPDVSVGVHKARCVKVIDLGTQKNDYQGDITWKRQCMLIWEVPSETNSNGEPLTISKFYTISLHEKSNLGADLTAWRGRAFTELEKQGFDISKLAGVPCMMNVVEGKNGRPRVSTLMPLPKGDDMVEQYHSTVVFSVDDYQKGNRDAFNQLADGIRSIILRSSELAESQDEGDDHNGEDIPDFSSDDDVPF